MAWSFREFGASYILLRRAAARALGFFAHTKYDGAERYAITALSSHHERWMFRNGPVLWTHALLRDVRIVLRSIDRLFELFLHYEEYELEGFAHVDLEWTMPVDVLSCVSYDSLSDVPMDHVQRLSRKS